MKPFDKCPICGNGLVEKEVEKLLRGGKNAAVVNVKADVCLHCGERCIQMNKFGCLNRSELNLLRMKRKSISVQVNHIR